MTVTVEIGATIPFAGQSFGNVRPMIRVEVDENGDVPAQTDKALQAAAYVVGRIDDQLEVTIVDLMSDQLGGHSLEDRLKDVEDGVTQIKQALGRLAQRLPAPTGG